MPKLTAGGWWSSRRTIRYNLPRAAGVHTFPFSYWNHHGRKHRRLLVIEGVIPPGNDPSFTKLLDLNMMVIPGGKERTEAEYRALCQAAGIRLTSITPTPSDVSVIEGRPA